jgi:hypothetical protein
LRLVKTRFPPVSAPRKRRSIIDMKWRIQSEMKESEKSLFDQQYRVVAVEGDRMFVRGIRSGEVLTIINPEPETPLTREDYPPGKLIALSDPSTAPLN